MKYSVDEFQYDSLPQNCQNRLLKNILNGIKHMICKRVGKVFYEAQQNL